MESKKIALLLASSMILSSCSLLPSREVEIITKPVLRKITQPVLPASIDLKEPVWYVVSETNFDEFIARVEKETDTLVFFAMSPGDYELMAYNMQEIKRYIRQMNEVIVYYRKVTTEEVDEPTSSVRTVEDR